MVFGGDMNNDTSRKCAHDVYYMDFIQRLFSHTFGSYQ